MRSKPSWLLRQALGKLRGLSRERPLPPVQPHFRSRFGGLWTDLTTAKDLLAGKVALGLIEEREAELLRHWIEQGYVVLPRAADPESIHLALQDLERSLNGEIQKIPMSYWEDATTKRFEPATRDKLARREAKILDLHTVSAATRRLIFCDPVLRFLHLLFERPILAFQTLTFVYGSEQPLHQDSAFVRVTSPLELVASWIALEDIEPGSGELVYYPGSHRLPEYLFEGKYKWAPAGSAELGSYATRLEQRAQQGGLKLQSFRPRRGDVLIWSAELFHGGAPRSRPDATRRSLVTHYCPIDQRPVYFPNSETHSAPDSSVDQFTSDPALRVP